MVARAAPGEKSGAPPLQPIAAGITLSGPSFVRPVFCWSSSCCNGVGPGPNLAPGSPQALSPAPHHRLPPAFAPHRRRRVYPRRFPDQIFPRPLLFRRFGPSSFRRLGRPLPVKSSGY